MNKNENEFTAAASSAEESDFASGHERLKTAIRQAKTAQADRLDSITDIREADIARLELLVQDLQTVFDAVPPQDEQWDFCLSHGMQPRLWLDASAFVMIARDRRSYRFVRDTRLGRVVLSESADIKIISAAVTRYIAGRIVERERLMDDIPSDNAEKAIGFEQDKSAEAVIQPFAPSVEQRQQNGALLSGIFWFIIGALLGGALLILVFHHFNITLPL